MTTQVNLFGGFDFNSFQSRPAWPVVDELKKQYEVVQISATDSIAVVDPGSKSELQIVSLHNPEPADLVAGRPFLYSAQLTSSNGEASCSSCHIFGDMDDLAWDLGNPDDSVKSNTNTFNPIVPGFADPLAKDFHPMLVVFIGVTEVRLCSADTVVRKLAIVM